MTANDEMFPQLVEAHYATLYRFALTSRFRLARLLRASTAGNDSFARCSNSA